jgi:excisionase family DNA binding protein
MIPTSEAANILGVSQRRVAQLAKAGVLAGKKVGGVWLIEESDIKIRAATINSSGGRPARGSRASETVFTLMNRTHKVADFVYDANTLSFSKPIRVYDTTRSPLGVDLAGKSRTKSSFNAWWRGRGIPMSRSGLEETLRELEVALPEELLIKSLGLSLSDQYWINPAHASLNWEDINFFTNSFSRAAVNIGQSPQLAHPDNTSDGNLPKHWIAEGKSRALLKGAGVLGQEPYNEVVATALHRRLLDQGRYVDYSLANIDRRTFSKCKTFVSSTEEFVPAVYVMSEFKQPAHHNNYQHYIECCASLGIDDAAARIDEMLVCDEVIANSDRHNRNFGIIRDIETNKCRMAPIFDSGTSLWCNVAAADLPQDFSFAGCTFGLTSQKRILAVSDFSWIAKDALDGFAQEALEILKNAEGVVPRMDYLERAISYRTERIQSICRLL